MNAVSIVLSAARDVKHHHPLPPISGLDDGLRCGYLGYLSSHSGKKGHLPGLEVSPLL